ncbi:MAG TPA: hypothetical protein PKY59_10395 [Pyrinomonadaceae bacterium]|nr:hypothetical protein [Pyrinomonadaceae bacterium]
MTKKFIIIGCFILAFSVFASAQNKSIYTSLETKDCKTIEQSDEGAGWYRGECPGTGGYKLELTEGDIRQSLNVITPAKNKIELDFSMVSSSFSSIGTKAEWRMKGKVPVALIVRFNVSDPEKPEKTTSYLIVTKLSKTEACITDVVKPSKTQNAQAQKSADAAATKPCKSFE